MAISDVLVPLVAFLVTVLEFVLRHTLSLVSWAAQAYPSAFQLVIGLVLCYLAYKFIRKLISIWLDLFVATIKTVAFFTVAAVLAAMYLRGFSRFVNSDLPYIKTLWNSFFENPGPVSPSGTGFWFLDTIGVLTNTNFEHLMAKVKEPLARATTTPTPEFDPYDFDPSDYLKYAQDHFGSGSNAEGLFDEFAAFFQG